MKFLIPSIFLLILVALTIGITVLSGETADVIATVSAQNVSVAVGDGTVAYGSLSFSATMDTLSLDPADSQWATNDGNLTENFNIMGTNSTGGTLVWSLLDTVGTNQYRHRVSTDDGTTWANLTTSGTGYITLNAGIAQDATSGFDLEIQVPSGTTDYSEQSVDVTVQAVDGT